jgi:uncharacterized membrane-anchored protein
MRMKFALLVLLQVALLISITGYRQYWIYAGEKVLLKTTPVDPRSLFRGDYVRLRYEISDIDMEKLPGDDGFMHNNTIYVILEKGEDGTYGASKVSRATPEDWPFIRGRVRHVYGSTLRVDYGIESYFVEENKGIEIEMARDTRELKVEASVLKSGKATISSLIMDGNRLR